MRKKKKNGLQTSFGPRLEVQGNKPARKIQENQLLKPNSKKDKWGSSSLLNPPEED